MSGPGGVPPPAEEDETKCGLCLTRDIAVNCVTCQMKRCRKCDNKYHNKRQGHERIPLQPSHHITDVPPQSSLSSTPMSAVSSAPAPPLSAIPMQHVWQYNATPNSNMNASVQSGSFLHQSTLNASVPSAMFNPMIFTGADYPRYDAYPHYVQLPPPPSNPFQPHPTPPVTSPQTAYMHPLSIVETESLPSVQMSTSVQERFKAGGVPLVPVTSSGSDRSDLSFDIYPDAWTSSVSVGCPSEPTSDIGPLSNPEPAGSNTADDFLAQQQAEMARILKMCQISSQPNSHPVEMQSDKPEEAVIKQEPHSFMSPPPESTLPETEVPVPKPRVKSLPPQMPNPAPVNIPTGTRPKFCSECGAKLLTSGKFCAECGNPIFGVQQQSSTLPNLDCQGDGARLSGIQEHETFHTPPESPRPEIKPSETVATSNDANVAEMMNQIEMFNLETRRSSVEIIETTTQGLETLTFLKAHLNAGTPIQKATVKANSRIQDDKSLDDNVMIIKDIFYTKVNQGMGGQNNSRFRLSDREALQALEMCPNDHMRAATIAQNARAIKCHRLGIHEFGLEKCHDALFHSGGDLSEALVEIQQQKLRDMKEHFVWNSDEDNAVVPENQQPINPYSLPLMTKTDEKIERELKRSNYTTPEEKNRCVRIVMCEKDMSFSCAMVLPGLLRNTAYSYVTCLVAAKDNPRNCQSYIKVCTVCLEDFPKSHMVELPNCLPDCKVCFDCVNQQLRVKLADHSINVLTIACPACGEPIIQEETSAIYAPQLRSLLDNQCYSQLEHRLFENSMRKNPNFKWCSHCAYGFLWEDQRLKMQCTMCKDYSCSGCGKKWHGAHDGITCDQFGQWELENDPEYQQNKLDAFLRCMNAMQCPACQFRYELVRGGCLHFTCGQCHTEFCGFCYAVYDRNCRRFQRCHLKNLHAHCPRYCFSFLRDNDVGELQQLLTANQVEFLRDPPPEQNHDRCQIRVNDGSVEGPCGKDVEPGSAGLCQIHYKEYLTTLIKKERVDPVSMMSADRCKLELQNHEIQFDPNLSEQQLRQIVQQSLPLPPLP